MLKAKIKISQITNLTDARYFAAWGVDYLGFDVDPDSEHFTPPSVVAEIAEWVEGPGMVLESNNSPDEILLNDYRKLLQDIIVEIPVTGSDHLTTFIDQKNNETYAILHSSKSWSSIALSMIDALIKECDHLLLDIPFGINEVDMILDSGVSGFVLRGGEEEKVGFKSYDDMDDLFDFLID